MKELDRSILRGSQADFLGQVRTLVLTDIVYKVIAFVLITPLVGVVFRAFVSFSGREVLADEDILFFALSPIGAIAIVVVGAISIGTLAFEQAALMTIIFSAEEGRRTTIRQALVFTATKALPIVLVTARLIGFILLIAVPFLVVAGVAYRTFLTEFDINYYLHEKPPVFLACLGLAAVLILGLLAVVIPRLAARSMALPLILFENEPVRTALQTSCKRTVGHRFRITSWLVLWGIANTLVSAILSGIVAWVGHTLITPSLSSLNVVVLLVGIVLALWLITNLVTTLIGATTFSVLLTNLYRRLSMDESAELPSAMIGEASPYRFVQRLSYKAIGGLVVVTVAAALGLGAWFIAHMEIDDQSAIMAHRGASAAAPENTLAAVQRAIDDKADWVEIDVQESSDGVVMVIHDSDLKKIGRSKLKVWESTAEQLRTVDIGSWFDPQFSDQRVPTLDEVLEMCKDRIRVNIELKYYGHDEQLEQRVAQLVKSHGMDEDVVIMSLKKDAVDKFKKLQPNWPAGLLTATAVGDLSRVKVDFLAVNAKLATPSFVRAVHGKGKQVYVWTVNDSLTMSVMMGRGVDAIITDNPARALAVRRERMKMNAMERLLLQLAALIGSDSGVELTIDDA